MKSRGYDLNFSKFGIVVKVTSPEKLKSMLTWVKGLEARAQGMYPAMVEGKAMYFTIAGTHITITLRMFKQGFKSVITGQTFEIPEWQTDLKEVCHGKGHYYKILDENVSLEDIILISSYYNSEQDNSLQTSDGSMLKSIQNVIREMPSNANVTVSTVLAKVQAKSLVRMNPGMVASLAKFCASLRDADFKFLDEFLSWQAVNVNPKRLVMAPSFFKDLATALNDAKLTMISVAETNYNLNHAMQQSDPLPDICDYYKASELIAYAKTEKLKKVEEYMVSNRAKLIPILEEVLPSVEALKLLQTMEHTIVHMAFGKSLDDSKFKCKFQSTLDIDKKLALILKSWGNWVNADFASVAALDSFVKCCALDAPGAAANADEVTNKIIKYPYISISLSLSLSPSLYIYIYI